MNALRHLLLRREAGIAVMIVLFCLAVGSQRPQFLTLDQLRIILLLTPLIMIGAMGQMMVIVARHVDLSIGSMLGFSAMVSGLLYRFDAGSFGFDVPWWTGIPLSIACGAALGFLNGALIQIFRLPAIIVTLGTLSLYRGLTEIKGLSQSSIFSIPKDFPIAGGFNIPWIVIIALGIAFLTYLFLDHSRIGRQIYAMGSNPTAAPLRGINVTAVTLLVFTLSGALSGLAGIMYASRWGFVNPSNTGSGFEFQVIAAVVIGGVSINGGVGTVLGTVLGVLLLGCVAAALPLLGIPGTSQAAIYGAVILIALLIDRTVRRQGVISLKRVRA
jgi:rhamnose transport system permease protein